jgi:beta-hydroxylase
MCPRTTELLKAIPNVKAAMFASLPPGARLVRHRDPYAGSLRYHLGLITPNSDQCYIVVDGERYFWRDGESMMFDETYIHHAENTTQMPRVILFCDIERPLKSSAMTAINRWFARNVMKASASQNVEGEKLGALNRLFGGFYKLRLRAKQLKARSRTAYYLLKWALLGGLIYLVFL